MRRAWIFIFSVLLLSISVAADSWEYKLVEGTLEVCKAYEKNLNVFKNLSYAMVCDRKISPEMNEFRKPVWKKLDIEKNKELVKRINKYLNYGDQFKNVDWLDNNITFNRFVTDVLIKTDSISYLSIDLDNDGKTDNVVKYEEGICQSRVYSKILMLLNENREEIDEARTQRLFSKLERSGFPGYLTNRHYKVYDIFFYKNEVYIDIWDGRISELTVYSIVKNKLCEICEYKFINKEEK